MEHLANLPITILVKAPNQKVGDQTVECFMDWTVRRLKSHLAAVYPNRPAEKNQRIIYSGKLLQDNSVLKDILRTIDSSTLHTVHLVCSPTPEELAESDKSQNSNSRPKPSSQSNVSPENPSSGRSESSGSSAASSRRTSVGDNSSPDGIRQRHVTRSDSSTSSGYNLPYTSQQYRFPTSPMAYQNLSPQQMQWMQQMYMQQMAAYYMQYQTGSSRGLPGMSPPWMPPAANQFHQPMAQPPVHQPAAPVPVNENIIQQAAAANVEAPRNAPVQNQQMNAGVGPVINDDEEEGANRDWLDWIYTLCRFGVLLSIVYFYSSMNRFLLVAGIMFIVYLYENNFFRLRRRPVGRAQVEERGNQEVQQEGAGERDGDSPDGAADLGPDAGVTEGDGSSSTDVGSSSGGEAGEADTPGNEETAEGQVTTEPDTPPRPGFLGVVWIFVSTFFTSLIPQGPQQLAAN